MKNLQRNIREIQNEFAPIRLKIASLAANEKYAELPPLKLKLEKLSDWADAFAQELDGASTLLNKPNISRIDD